MVSRRMASPLLLKMARLRLRTFWQPDRSSFVMAGNRLENICTWACLGVNSCSNAHHLLNNLRSH